MVGRDRLTPSQCLGVLETFSDVDRDSEERERALNDLRVPDGMVMAFVAMLSGGTRDRALACCERPYVLDQWAMAGDASDRILIAFNPHTCSATLRRLAQHPNPRVRANVAYNPRTPPDVLASLLLDRSQDVRDAVADAFDSELGQALRRGLRNLDLEPDGD